VLYWEYLGQAHSVRLACKAPCWEILGPWERYPPEIASKIAFNILDTNTGFIGRWIFDRFQSVDVALVSMYQQPQARWLIAGDVGPVKDYEVAFILHLCSNEPLPSIFNICPSPWLNNGKERCVLSSLVLSRLSYLDNFSEFRRWDAKCVKKFIARWSSKLIGLHSRLALHACHL